MNLLSRISQILRTEIRFPTKRAVDFHQPELDYKYQLHFVNGLPLVEDIETHRWYFLKRADRERTSQYIHYLMSKAKR